jgi:rhodanese-related sulfurtransferase
VYGETSTDGALAAKLLIVAGFRNVVHVDGGIKAWIERGMRLTPIQHSTSNIQHSSFSQDQNT